MVSDWLTSVMTKGKEYTFVKYHQCQITLVLLFYKVIVSFYIIFGRKLLFKWSGSQSTILFKNNLKLSQL